MSEREVPLRLHHVPSLKDAETKGVRAHALEHLGTAKNVLMSHRLNHPTDLAYYLDVIGEPPDLENWNENYPSTSSESAYVGRIRSALDRYLSLPNDTFLKLIPIGPDWICDSTCFKAHCSLDTIFTKTEQRIAYRLRESKKHLGVEGVFIIRDRGNFNDFHALTTVGVIRTILNKTVDVQKLIYGIPSASKL
jgi:hypothetical protein